MPPKESEQNPLSEAMNIRPPEERYGGEGHTDDQESPRKRGDSADAPPDMPEVDSDDLVERPTGTPQQMTDEPGGYERRSGVERSDSSKH